MLLIQLHKIITITEEGMMAKNKDHATVDCRACGGSGKKYTAVCLVCYGKGKVDWINLKDSDSIEVPRTYEDFHDFCTKVPDNVYGIDGDGYYGHNEFDTENSIYYVWNSGGYTGGSCWDDAEPYRYDNDREKDGIPWLEAIVMNLFPKLSHFEFEDIKSHIESDYFTNYEYYGNSDDYNYEFISIKKLWGLLKNYGHVE